PPDGGGRILRPPSGRQRCRDRARGDDAGEGRRIPGLSEDRTLVARVLPGAQRIPTRALFARDLSRRDMRDLLPSSTTGRVRAPRMSRPVEDIQQEGVTGACRYDVEIDVSADSTHAKVVRLVGSNKRVLELGCATGYMSRVLRERGCQVVAVEVNRDGAARAEEFCERVICANVEHVD